MEKVDRKYDKKFYFKIYLKNLDSFSIDSRKKLTGVYMNENVQLLTVRQFAQKHPFITQGGLRWIIYSNNLFRETCVRKLGGKVLLVEQEVMNFILHGKGKMKT